MIESPRDFALRDSYQMYHLVVVDANGKEKTFIAQNGGGTLSLEDMADRAVRYNWFPGAKSVSIHPANTIMPAKTIEKFLEGIKKTGLKVRPSVTPRPTIGKPVVAPVFETPSGVPDAEVPPEEDSTMAAGAPVIKGPKR